MKSRLILPAYGRDLFTAGWSGSPLMTFASLFNVVLTLAFTDKRIFSLVLAFGSVLLELPFLIGSDGLTFF